MIEKTVSASRPQTLPRKSWAQIEGQTYPLGATWLAEENAVNFAIYSKHATRVTLLLFEFDALSEPCLRFEFDSFKNKTGPVWHCRLSIEEIGRASYYGYQVDGPAPADGFLCHCFDLEKLLLDPYAKSVYFPKRFNRVAAIGPGSNVGMAPLGVLPHLICPFDWQDDFKPRHDHDLVIYEMHVKGFTANPNSEIDDQKLGTFLGVIDKIPHLVELGITAVELMPVFQYEPGVDNYWGYMPLNFFSPHDAYSTSENNCDHQNEFRTMVRALHAAGIEVILDVVFNHTCEQGLDGPTYSFKGIDNSTYYMLDPGAKDPFVNFSGTGNTLHTVNAATRQMIVDSLRYWVQEMHVDGFRFDLASIFTRYPDGQINTEDPPIFSQIAAEDDLAGMRFIAEPWDAVGTNQLGRKFPGRLAMQWNADYRDTVQRFVRGDKGMVPDLMTRIYGSADHFPDDRIHAYRPTQSINYVTCHDGMTMYDLVAYSAKNNWANGEYNQDGPDEYRSNSGWEGDVGVPASVLRLRKQLVKNFFAILMLSNGTPMFRMGDEFLQTQRGNNNPYNQDSKTTWLDWKRKREHGDVFRFCKMMIDFRRRHPSISRSRFWRSDVRWYGAQHEVDLSPASRQLAWCLHGKSLNDADLYVMLNCHEFAVDFGVYEGTVGQWHRVVDTSLPAGKDIVDEQTASPIEVSTYAVQPRSVVVLIR